MLSSCKIITFYAMLCLMSLGATCCSKPPSASNDSAITPPPKMTINLSTQTIKPAPTPQPAHEPKNISLPISAILHSAVRGGWFGASARLTNSGLPKNSRQTNEGYWLGSQPMAEDVEELDARNIKLVLTLATIPRKQLVPLQAAFAEKNIEQVYLPFGSRFPNPDSFMPQIMKYEPSQIFIHCAHGSDRTGAVLAYILIARHHWDIAKALYAVIQPSTCNIRKLDEILTRRGFKIDASDFNDIAGMYSPENNGGYGGMKVCADTGNYLNLIDSLITKSKTLRSDAK